MNDFKDLSRYSRTDAEKYLLLSEAFRRRKRLMKAYSFYLKSESENDIHEDFAMETQDFYDDNLDLRLETPSYDIQSMDEPRICPKCHKRYPAGESICPDCLIRLKKEDELNQIMDLKIAADFTFKGDVTYGDFTQLLSPENLAALTDAAFSVSDLDEIIHDIKKTAFIRLNDAIKDNSIRLDDLDILNTVILFVKSFVNVEYKSTGHQLGYYEFNSISIDDRQSKSHQITTLLHELTHFLVKEILTHSLCRILNASKNAVIEALVTYSLTYIKLSQLVDEYAAHTVEARFTVFGYQDYSSFLNIEHDLDEEDVQVAKMIGNNFANEINEIIESFLDFDLREKIKSQFGKDNAEDADYRQLLHESCKYLTGQGFVQSILLILTEGFTTVDLEILETLKDEFDK